MPNFYEIPLTASPQKFKVQMSGTTYQMRLAYMNADEGGWLLDIAKEDGTPMVSGIPLVTGADLLQQYQHLGFAGRLWVKGNIDPDAVPSFDNIGSDVLLFWVTD